MVFSVCLVEEYQTLSDQLVFPVSCNGLSMRSVAVHPR